MDTNKGKLKQIKGIDFRVNKEFIFLVIIGTALLFSLMNNQDGKILQKVNENSAVSVNNTDKIINAVTLMQNQSSERYNISDNRYQESSNITMHLVDNVSGLIKNVSTLITDNEKERQTMGIDVINIIFLYLKDLDLNQEKIMKEMGISNVNLVENNGTHIFTNQSNGTVIQSFAIPYPLNFTNINTIKADDNIRNITR